MIASRILFDDQDHISVENFSSGPRIGAGLRTLRVVCLGFTTFYEARALMQEKMKGFPSNTTWY